MTFDDLSIGDHYRLMSVLNPGIVLPSVRVKVSATHYRVLHPSQTGPRLAARQVEVLRVTEREKAGK